MIDLNLKEAWQWLTRQGLEPNYFKIVMDAYLDAEAWRRMAKFKLAHARLMSPQYGDTCLLCGTTGDHPRHNWTLAEWRAELERELND